MRQFFLDWGKPFLPEVVDFLLNPKNEFDENKSLLVLPTRRMKRRLEILFKRRRKERGFSLSQEPNAKTPILITLGDLPEFLYRNDRPFASVSTRLSVWRSVLNATIRNDINRLKPLFPFPPNSDDWSAQTAIVRILDDLHIELGANGALFNEVARKFQRCGMLDEIPRWNVLATLFQNYRKELDRLGLSDEQITRIQAVEQNACRSDRTVYLIGTVDLNAVQRRMITSISNSVVVLTCAPVSRTGLFDSLGNVVPEYWEKEPVLISDARIFPVDSPARQAEIVADWVHNLKNSLRLSDESFQPLDDSIFPTTNFPLETNDSPPRLNNLESENISFSDVSDNQDVAKYQPSFCVSVPNEDVLPFLERRAFQNQWTICFATGEPLRKSRIFRLFQILAEYLKNRKFKTLTELLRLPDVEDYILTHWNKDFEFQLKPGDWLGDLDRYQNTYLPDRVDGFWKSFINEDVPSENSTFPFLNRANAVLEKLLAFFKRDSRSSVLRVSNDSSEADSDLTENNDASSVASVGEILENSRFQWLILERRLSLQEWGKVLDDFLTELYSFEDIEAKSLEAPNAPLGSSPTPLDDSNYSNFPSDFVEEGRTINRFRPEDSEKTLATKRRQIELSSSVFRRAFEEIASVPLSNNEILSGSEAINFILQLVANERLMTEEEESDLVATGWLDSAFDDSLHIAITGFNDGVIPSPSPSDSFLSANARRFLGLDDARSRYARDAYYLSAILARNPETPIIYSRRSLEGDPLLPSRLLFADNPETVAARVRRFFDSNSDSVPNSDICSSSAAVPTSKEDREIEFPEIASEAQSRNSSAPEKKSVASRNRQKSRSLQKPPVLRMNRQPPSIMKVTEFRDFLACPYRYFLRTQLMLKTTKDDYLELDAAAFGNVVHHILKEFGVDERIRDAVDPDVINDWLCRRLDQFSADFFGGNASPVVSIQQELIRKRLKSFAYWQARWRSEGNVVKYAEATTKSETIILNVDNVPVRIKGRIDRIDYNPKLNRWFVFDYKTFDQIDEGKKDKNFEFDSESISTGIDNTVDRKHRKRKAFASGTNPISAIVSQYLTLPKPNASNILNPNDRLKTKRNADSNFSRSENGSNFSPAANDSTLDAESLYEWTDLQLPLYRLFFREILREYRADADEIEPTLGYIVLPQGEAVKAIAAPWKPSDLATASETLFWVIRTVRRLWKAPIRPDALIDPLRPEKGTILAEKAPAFTEDLAPITLENQFVLPDSL